jgi:hypothetical protein
MMRSRFLGELRAAGYPTDPFVPPHVVSRVQSFCPGTPATAVDFYLLGAHEQFGIPTNNIGNHLAPSFMAFPLFSPVVSVNLTFAELMNQCGGIGSDREAIRVFGGMDPSYSYWSTQDKIFGYYKRFAASHCW